MVTVAVRMRRCLWIEDLIGLIERGVAGAGSVPDSVESRCRRIGATLAVSGSLRWYKVVVKNMSSGYAAFASSEWPEPMQTGQDSGCWSIAPWRREGLDAAAITSNPTDCDERTSF